MVNRRATVALVTLVALAVAGCGGSSKPPVATDQNDKGQLEIWVRRPPGSASEKTAKDLAAKFTEKTGVPTNVTAIFDGFETKVQQAASARKLPDIIINDTAQLGAMLKQGILREIDKKALAGGDKLTPVSWDAAKGADGKYWAVPFSAQSFALFIRKDWREKLGMSAPKSWDDLVNLSVAFTTKDPDGNGKPDTYGMDVPGSINRGYMSWFFSTFLWSGGGDYFDGTVGKFTPAINNDASVAAVSWFKDLFCKSKVVQPGAVTMETTPAHQVFETGKAGIYLTGPYNMARFDKSLGKDKYEVVASPPGPGGKATALAEGENVYLLDGSKNKSGQLKFAEFSVSVEGQTIGMAGDTEGNIVRLPINSDPALGSVRKDTRWQIFADVYTKDGRYVPAVPDFSPFRQSSAEAINAIVANCASDTKAELTKLAGKFGDELKKQGVAG
jgi:multiple sugar transport system substrate-binding protein